jgi:hypothetical protein
VLFHFENLRSQGFSMRTYTMSELEALFPYDPKNQVKYLANKQMNADQELDLGPAVHNFKNDQKLVRGKGGVRSYPRNMKVKPEALTKLGVQLPPLVPGMAPGQPSVYQSPSLWFGGSSSPTASHSDCCDNFVLQILGSKRFTLSPPTDWQLLAPKCVGKRKNLCFATPADPTTQQLPYGLNKMQIDVKPGQILYMPSGWFHHVHNLGATLMTNVWTRSRETVGISSCNRQQE